MQSKTPFETDIVVRIYHEYPNELGNKQIKELFCVKSDASASRIKQGIRELMMERGTKAWHPNHVNTKTTFEYAGINIEEYKRLYKEKRRLGLGEEMQ